MKINQDKLTIIYNSVNLSNELYKVDGSESIILDPTTYLYVGFRKPISQLFIELETANTNDVDLIVEKYTDSWTEVDLNDETDNLNKSSLISMSDIEGESQVEVEGITENFIRISTSGATSAMLIRLINLMFSTADDLSEEEPYIDKFQPKTINSHIYSLISARKYILRKINNGGSHKYNSTDLRYYNINQFDIFDVNELREASNYYALYKIYHNISDGLDDQYRQKSIDYFNKYQSSFALFSDAKLSIDKNDDGEESTAENVESVQTVKIIS